MFIEAGIIRLNCDAEGCETQHHVVRVGEAVVQRCLAPNGERFIVIKTKCPETGEPNSDLAISDQTPEMQALVHNINTATHLIREQIGSFFSPLIVPSDW